MIICPNCNGKVFLPAKGMFPGKERCPSCRHTGMVPDNKGGWEKCSQCQGYGWVGERPDREGCPLCLGVGITPPKAK